MFPSAEEINEPFENLYKEWGRKVSERVDVLFETHVRPILDRRKLNLRAGMGCWTLTKRDKKMTSVAYNVNGIEIEMPYRDDEEIIALAEFLSLPVEGLPANDLGSLMSDYPKPKGKKRM